MPTQFKKQWSESWCGFDLFQLSKKALHHLAFVEKQIIMINLLMLLLAMVGFIFNHFVTKYYVPVDYIGFVPGSVLLIMLAWIWSSANRQDFPKTSCFLLACLYTLLTSFCLGVFAVAVMLTPSPWVLSHQLLAVDQWLGFHQLAVMHWMGRHLALAQTFAWAYEGWGWQVLVVAPVLVICKQFPRACAYLFYSSILSLVYCLIYWIWPSLSPAAVLPQHIFDDSCYNCIHRFELLRHHHHYAFGTCGLIDFPSYHVALAVLAVWAFWRVQWLNIIVTLFNIWVILATFLLGYHFLIDVVVSFLIVGLLFLANIKKPLNRTA